MNEGIKPSNSKTSDQAMNNIFLIIMGKVY